MIDDKCPIHDEFEPDCEACQAFVVKFLDENSELMNDLMLLEKAEKQALEELDRKKNGSNI